MGDGKKKRKKEHERANESMTCERVTVENIHCVIVLQYEAYKQIQNKDKVCSCWICVGLNLNRGC